ncbi:MAG TPA: 16S rRNA (guanine(527)-N(7))-methyltransferase RsmG [Acidobacteriaceae bacterium]
MAITPDQVEAAAARWGVSSTATPVADRLAAYGNLLMRWNARLSLTAIRDEANLIERHLMEGVFAASHHPPAKTALDFGSGTGVPGIPIAICREDIAVTLAESQGKKAAFLREVTRHLGLNTAVHAGRAETLPRASFDAVWIRAVDKSATMLAPAAALVASAGSLCLLGTGIAPQLPSDLALCHWKTLRLPGSSDRVLHIGRREECSTWNT